MVKVSQYFKDLQQLTLNCQQSAFTLDSIAFPVESVASAKSPLTLENLRLL